MTGKAVTLFFWGAVIASLFAIFPKPITSMLGWAGVAILLVHFVEVAMFTRRFGGQLVEPKFDKLMVLVFGIFHVLPFMLNEVESRK